MTIGAGDLKFEDRDVKAMWLYNGWIALYAGSPTFAGMVVSHGGGRLEAVEKEDGKPVLEPFAVMGIIHDAYLNIWDLKAEDEVLRPRFLNLELYRKGISDDAMREATDEELAVFEHEDTAELLLCGFDSVGQAAIVRVDLRTQERESGFGAVGSGADIARSRLIWQKTQPSDELARVLYEVYEAKAHAEMNAFVGPSVDAFVMYGNGERNLRMISEDTKTALNAVFRYNDQTPFLIARRDGELERPAPSQDWEGVLIEQKLRIPDHLIARRRVALSFASPSAPALPSSQSQSGEKP